MTPGRFEQDARPAASPGIDEPAGADHGPHSGHSGWMMMICCVPMLLIAGALVVTGVAGAGTVIFVIGCTLMMYLMMRGMDHGTGSGTR